MSSKIKKLLSVVVVIFMFVSISVTASFAEEPSTIWYGDSAPVEVQAGTDGYTFLSVYQSPRHAYEMSNHMVSADGGVNNDIPQTLVMIDASKDYTWTPDSKYSFGASNYEVLYCCDAEYGYEDGIYYKRMNLEDSEYYDKDDAAHIFAIVIDSYPFVTIEQMKETLTKDGFEGAEDLTRAEIITAVQAAIWAYANPDLGQYVYSQTFDVSSNPQWGGVMHDYTAEMDVWWKVGKRVFSTNETVEARINSLIKHLMAKESVYANKNQIVITDLKMVGAPVCVNKAEQTYSVELKITLNNSGSSNKDNIAISVTAGDFVTVIPVVYGTEEYTFNVTAKRGDEIKAVVSGTQILPQGVYFYSPKPADVDGDGVATSREVSQSLVGVSMGETDVYAEDSVYFNDVTFKSGTVSNISYMLIDKETGEVEFIDKIDLGNNDTFAPIIEKDGYISAMFMKQSTTGLFWISEEVDEATVNAVIDCLIANNPSYKGHDEDIAFGFGDHDLNYTKGKNTKTITYRFGN